MKHSTIISICSSNSKFTKTFQQLHLHSAVISSQWVCTCYQMWPSALQHSACVCPLQHSMLHLQHLLRLLWTKPSLSSSMLRFTVTSVNSTSKGTTMAQSLPLDNQQVSYCLPVILLCIKETPSTRCSTSRGGTFSPKIFMISFPPPPPPPKKKNNNNLLLILKCVILNLVIHENCQKKCMYVSTLLPQAKISR